MIPKLLQNIPDPPAELFVKGSLSDDFKIAVVGTRKSTSEGRLIARTIAAELAKAKITIVSGLALGIDTASHEGCLEAKGKTIAVLGTGIDNIYPKENKPLAERILAKGGAIVSEYPGDTPGYKENFLRRNRIISGLCEAIVVVEAPIRSGSISTANFAAEQGREVFVIPGPINHPNYAGSHKLIRDGARLVASAKDILEDLGIEVLDRAADLDDSEKTIVEAVRVRALPIDKIMEITKLEPSKALPAIAGLVLKKIIRESDEGYVLNQ
ncbi:MAG TPA: DNA-processing protein DprA [Candidatus Colwellbacteria bacterium]|nr:DNA-processing protein DprA [Candidatus Colwellbacteria bacterium]HQA96294.1 DNA-processing protein DprA [Candidatus Colwellbacteria bacterium]